MAKSEQGSSVGAEAGAPRRGASGEEEDEIHRLGLVLDSARGGRGRTVVEGLPKSSASGESFGLKLIACASESGSEDKAKEKSSKDENESREREESKEKSSPKKEEKEEDKKEDKKGEKSSPKKKEEKKKEEEKKEDKKGEKSNPKKKEDKKGEKSSPKKKEEKKKEEEKKEEKSSPKKKEEKKKEEKKGDKSSPKKKEDKEKKNNEGEYSFFKSLCMMGWSTSKEDESAGKTKTKAKAKAKAKAKDAGDSSKKKPNRGKKSSHSDRETADERSSNSSSSSSSSESEDHGKRGKKKSSSKTLRIHIPYRETSHIPSCLFEPEYDHSDFARIQNYNVYIHETSRMFSVDSACKYVFIKRKSKLDLGFARNNHQNPAIDDHPWSCSSFHILDLIALTNLTNYTNHILNRSDAIQHAIDEGWNSFACKRDPSDLQDLMATNISEKLLEDYHLTAKTDKSQRHEPISLPKTRIAFHANPIMINNFSQGLEAAPLHPDNNDVNENHDLIP
ncbi:hypothetical protein OJ252_3206 [Cryptosporidium canis]|uniref:Uncharacterized protein n=1 Tax=Cryptosporidium canis TaxID=195482 RepID=A0ABQ8P3B2_9CRYT|nr:hypothetical protein OJ252_3206 [Cryptosporidium canis]